MAAAAASRKTLEASVWYRGGIVGPLTAQSLSALLQTAAATPEVGDIRCQVRCTDGFSLRLYGVGDEGFESDEGDGSATGSIDDRSQEELRVSDHVLLAEQPKSGMVEEDSSSANSSCSDTEDPNSSTDSATPATTATASQTAQVIHGTDMLFCHTDPTVPCGILFVTRQPRSARTDNALEAIILRCTSEAIAKEIYSSYLDITRRLKWERYTNSKRKKDIIRASFRNLNLQPEEAGFQDCNDARNLVSGRSATMRQIIHERDTQPPSLISLPTESERRLHGPSDSIVSFSGPHSLPEASEISRILSLSTPEDGWAEVQTAPASQPGEERRGRSRHKLMCQTPIRYSHNKGPAPPLPAPRQHPTNPNLLLVPTKNGLEPYRVINCEGPPPSRPLLLGPSEFSPRYNSGAAATLDWPPGHKSGASQFDTNNNRSRAPARQPPLFWVPGAAEPAVSGWAGSRRPELRRRARSKSPGERHRGFELAGALSSAIRGIKGQLRRAPAEAPPTVSAVNPKSVMKKTRPCHRVAGNEACDFQRLLDRAGDGLTQGGRSAADRRWRSARAARRPTTAQPAVNQLLSAEPRIHVFCCLVTPNRD